MKRPDTAPSKFCFHREQGLICRLILNASTGQVRSRVQQPTERNPGRGRFVDRLLSGVGRLRRYFRRKNASQARKREFNEFGTFLQRELELPLPDRGT
jgi:hypothetical protein